MSGRTGKLHWRITLAIVLGSTIAVEARAGTGAGAGADVTAADVTRVQAPSSRVASWFPVGSDLKFMPANEFEDLVRAVRDRPGPPRRASVLRARHSARWEAGVLVGRSELTLQLPDPGPPDFLTLEPWSPALLTPDRGLQPFRTTVNGRLGVLVEASSPSTLAMDWRQRARPGSDGRAFGLSSPEVEVSALVLELPTGLVPDRDSGAWIGPEPGSTPDRSTWRIEGVRGPLDLRLRDRRPDDSKPGLSTDYWLEGPTRIDLNASPSNWKAKWSLDERPGAPGRLVVELDPGLELVDITGPRVGSFRVEPIGKSSRVTIELKGSGLGPSPITIDAICYAPTDGTWAIPSARALNATWTGGRTSVRLDPSRVLQTCSERSGRRVIPRAGDPLDSSALIFEPVGGIGPVAELTFRKPAADSALEIRGHLRLDEAAPRIEVALSWTVHRGRLLTHAVDLPPGWTPDRVAMPNGQAVAWHPESLSKGGTRVQMSPSLPDDALKTLTLVLFATARESGGLGSLELPRVRPGSTGPRISDEVWVATLEPGLAARPIVAQGLAWLDPFAPSGTKPWTVDELRGALAWRWLADDAEAKVDRIRVRNPNRGDVRLDATVSRGRIKFDWRIAIDSTEPYLRSIPIHADGPLPFPFPSHWRSAEAEGSRVEVHPLSDAMKLFHGFPVTGPAWELELSGDVRGKVELLANDDQPWLGSGSIPLLKLPARYLARGLVSVAVPETEQAAIRATGLTPIDLSESTRNRPPPANETLREGDVRLRNAGIFSYRTGGVGLALATTPGLSGPTGGVVREALLATQVYPGSGLRHRLNLRIAVDQARSIDLTMPPGVVVERIRRDGQTVPVAPVDGSLRVAIPAPTSGRPSTGLTLEYRTSWDFGKGRLDPSTLVPACSLPCLSFVWELTLPEHWDVVGPSIGLASADPSPSSTWWSRLLGFRSPSWPRVSIGRDTRGPEREAMLRELDSTLADFSSDETLLGEWLLKVDAGRWPIVVDRLALQASGWGPMSRLGPLGPEVKAFESVAKVLPTLGLSSVAFDGLILITTRVDAPARPGAGGEADLETWQPALTRAATTGSDLTDRFQSAARYRGESTPRALSAADSPERVTNPSGWRRHRVVSTNWPRPGMSIGLVDRSWEMIRGWLVASITLAVGVAARKAGRRHRAAGLLSVLIVASVSVASAYPASDVTATGLIRGALAVLAFWVGRSLQGSTTAPRSDLAPTTVVRRSRLLRQVGTGLGVLGAVGFAALPTLARVDPDGTILVVFPFDGIPEPMARPKQAVLLLDDFEKLTRLARPVEPMPGVGATLKAVTHRVVRDGKDSVVVESRFEVEAGSSGEGPGSWVIPVGTARDLAATVDDQPTPIQFEADGASAVVAIPRLGVHSLLFRREVSLTADGSGGLRIKLPVNRSSFARVVVVGRDIPSRSVEVPNAVGQAEAVNEGLEVELGPLAELEVRWQADGQGDRSENRGPIEATMLWDARPSGDLVHARLIHANPDGLATLRIATEPEVQIGGLKMDRVVGVRPGGTPDRPEWVVHFDPPLPSGEPFPVDFWRPALAGSIDRRMPRLDFPGMTRVKTLVGLRRQADWSGRLEERATFELVAESNFERAWGSLPDDGLVLAGAVKFSGSGELNVATGPSSPRRSARTSMAIDLKPGRLDAVIEALVTDRQGRSFDLEVGLPTDFRIIKLDMPGLVDWQKVARDRIRLQFDGSEARQRMLRIQGYLPASPESVLSESRVFRARVPWPRFSNVDHEPGSLTLNSPTKASIEVLEGLTLVTSEVLDESVTLYRTAYRVERVDGLGPVHWSSPAAKVAVSVLSDLTIDPNTVTWTAIIQGNVSGGPARSLHWKLPREWAKQATLEVDGVAQPLTLEVKGESTICSITPDSPIWGRTRLVLRSQQALRPGLPFAYPEIAPLSASGRGEVERYDLTIANVSGKTLEVAGSPGLQAVDTSAFEAENSSSPAGSIDRAYHVTGPRWSLQLRVGSADDIRQTRVAQAEVTAVIANDGLTWGRARLDLEPRPGPFLRLTLPDSADLPWATVDGLPAPTIRQGPGIWLVPLGDGESRRVMVAWMASKVDPAGASLATVVIPGLDQPVVPSIIAVMTPDHFEPGLGGATFDRIDQSAWELENVERLASRVDRSFAEFDRVSRRDRDTVVEDLVEFEIRARSLERLKSSRAAVDRVTQARALIEEAGQNSGLDDLIQEARKRVGILSTFSDLSTTAPVESVERLRLRRSGTPWFFRKVQATPGRPTTITWKIKPQPEGWRRPEAWWMALAGLSLSLSLSGLIFLRPGKLSKMPLVVGAVVVLTLLFGLEPLGLVGVVALAGLGRLMD